MNLSRRQLINRGVTFAAAVAALPLLQACGGSTTADPNFTKAQTIISTVTGVVSALGASVAGVVGISPATIARWQSDATQIASIATDLLGVTTASAGQPIATLFGNAVSALLNDMQGSSGLLPPSVKSAVADIQTVMPFALAAFQVVMAFASPLNRRATAPVDVDVALLNLQAFTQSHH